MWPCVESYKKKFKNKLFKIFISLECKHNKLVWYKNQLHWGEQAKVTLLYGSLSTTRLTAKKSIHERLLSQEQRDSECFPVSFGICPPSSAEEHPETALKAWRGDSWRSCVRVSLCWFFHFCSYDRLSGSEVIIATFKRQSNLSEAWAGENNMAYRSVWTIKKKGKKVTDVHVAATCTSCSLRLTQIYTYLVNN